jgi:hypothetical protein
MVTVSLTPDIFSELHALLRFLSVLATKVKKVKRTRAKIIGAITDK